MFEFFIITPIGLEKLALDELQLKLSMLNIQDFKTKELKGGIQLETEDIQLGLNLNYFLKIPTRILLRVKEQKCRDLPKLFKIMKRIDWKHYLRQENIQFIISASKSRLINTKRIEETAIDAISAYFNANRISKKVLLENIPDQQIYLRFHEDLLTISLDTSGSPLYERSTHIYRGKAGIRENFCSACLSFLIKDQVINNSQLIDPMCGSGTFLKEASSFFKENRKDFAFVKWNLELKPLSITLENRWNFTNIKGIEIDPKVVANKDPELNIEQGDFYNLKDFETPTIIIINPPYGKRIKIKDPNTFFIKLIEKCKSLNNLISFGIIIPTPYSFNIPCKRRLKFNQNSIKVEFLVF